MGRAEFMTRAERHRLRLVTPPAGGVVSLALQKEHMRVFHDDEDLTIALYMDAARETVDGPNGWLGRALAQQTWDMALDDWPRTGRIRLPLQPLIRVDSVKYRDPDGVIQTVAPADYQVVDGGVSPSFVLPEKNRSWPGVDSRPDSVTVQFTAGYPPTGAGESLDHGGGVPARVKAALMILAAEMYERREMNVQGTIIAELPTVRNLLTPFKASWW